MAGTTTNYGFPYPTSGDNVSAGAAKIQELAQSLEDFFDTAAGASAFVGIGGNSTYAQNTAYSRASVTTSFVTLNTPSSLTYTFTPRSSGLFMVNFSGNGKASTAGVNWWISPDISGGATLGANKARGIAGTGTDVVSGAATYVVDGTANTTITIAIQAQAASSTTVTLNDHMMQVVYLG